MNPRIAWFTPLPPIRSGIGQYNRDLLPALSSSHSIDVFVDGNPDQFPSPARELGVFTAHDFLWKHRSAAYDLVVYQLGNAPCHDYMWPYLVRYPGLVVLHDGQLHHARGRLLLQRRRQDDYRREFWFNHPHANVDLAELGVAGLLGSLTYFLPMLRVVMESARHVVVHNHWLADQLRESHPATSLSAVEMGVPAPAVAPDAKAQKIRQQYGISNESVLFVAFGKVTPEKRIAEAVRALAAMNEAVPDTYLLLVGETVDYYDPVSHARVRGIGHKVSVAGYIQDDQIDDYVAAADVCLCMRWPTSRETSASWLRCLAAGRPTITTDLVHTVDIPTLDTRDGSILGRGAPVGVSIDILDEKHALSLAMRRLAQDARLREVLGKNARELWNSRFRFEHMVDGYRHAIDLAAKARPPSEQRRAALPAHLLADGTEYAARVLREAGFSGSPTADIWTHKAD